jgi:hypothetical protein
MMRQLLNGLPVLAKLVISGFTIDDYGLDSICLPSLRSLKIVAKHDFAGAFVDLKVISAPSLEDLTLEAYTSYFHFGRWTLPWDPTAITRFPLLRSLTLNFDDGIPPAVCIVLGSTFPTVTQLTVLNVEPIDFIHILDDSGALVWPNLHTIASNMFPVDIDGRRLVYKALCKRLSLEKPIKRLQSTEPLQLPESLVVVENFQYSPIEDVPNWNIADYI